MGDSTKRECSFCGIDGGGAGSYEQPYDEHIPLVCFDKKPVQLLEDLVPPILPTPGLCEK